MYLNCNSSDQLCARNIITKQLFAIASENGGKTLALTDVKSTSTCLDFERITSKYKIKPILSIAFRKSAQSQFILIPKNNNGCESINDYLSDYLKNPELQIPESAPELEDIFVIYPYDTKKTYQLKENEFLGITPKDLNHLKFSKWNSIRNKLVVLKTVSFQNKNDFSTLRLLRAIDNNTLLSKLSKSKQSQEISKMLPYQELNDLHIGFPELSKNTGTILEEIEMDYEFSNEKLNNQSYKTRDETLDFRLSNKHNYANMPIRYQKSVERVATRI